MNELTPHPLLKDEMVIWVGKSPVSNKFLIIRFIRDRESHSICPADLAEGAKMLGLHTEPHWTTEEARKGHMAFREHVQVSRYDYKEKIVGIEVDPIVKSIISGENLKNNQFLHMLRREKR